MVESGKVEALRSPSGPAASRRAGDATFRRLPDSARWHNRFPVQSARAGETYTVGQDAFTKTWGCSCQTWLQETLPASPDARRGRRRSVPPASEGPEEARPFLETPHEPRGGPGNT